MQMRIEQEVTPLARMAWTFTTLGSQLNPFMLTFDSYEYLERQTTRHKFRIVHGWARLGHHRRQMPKIIERPPVPNEVVEEALERGRHMVTVNVTPE